MASIIVIGLTGGIATGKSTVGRILQQKGIEVISSDKLSHQAMAPGEPAYYKIVEEFGRDVLTTDGSIDRKLLGAKVFKDGIARKKLEQIIHPVVIDRIKKEIALCSLKGHNLVVVEVPLLFESGLTEMFNLIWAVTASPEIQLKRLLARDHLTEEEAKERIASQLPLSEKEKRADAVIINNNGIGSLETQIAALLRTLE